MEQTVELPSLGTIAGELTRIGEALASLEAQAELPSPGGGNVQLSRLVRAASYLESAVRVLTEKEQYTPSWKSGVDLRHPVEDLQGSTRAVPIQDLLSFLANSRKSGLLRIHAAGEKFLVQLGEGAIVYAYGDDPPEGEGLGEILLQQGAIQPEQQARFGARSQQSEQLDPVLLQEHWLSQEALVAARARQARLAIFRLCAAESVRYWFYEGARIQNAVQVRLNAMELLLEYTSTHDEASEAARRTLKARLRRMLQSFSSLSVTLARA